MNFLTSNVVHLNQYKSTRPLSYDRCNVFGLASALKPTSDETSVTEYDDMTDGQLAAILVLRCCAVHGRTLTCLGERMGVYFRDLCADGDPSCLVLYCWIEGNAFPQDPEERAMLKRFATGEFDDPETGQKYYERGFGPHIPEELARFRIFRASRLWSPFNPRFQIMLQARRAWLLSKVNGPVEVQP